MIYKRGEALREAQKVLRDNQPFQDQSRFDVNIFICDQNTLEMIKHSQGYNLWAAKLFAAGRKIEDEIDRLLESIHKEKTGLFKRCKKLRSHLDQAFCQLKSLQDFAADVREFQNCLLATDLNQKGEAIDTLSDLVRQLSDKVFLSLNLINRKLNEIISARITAGNIFLTILIFIVAAMNFIHFVNHTVPK